MHTGKTAISERVLKAFSAAYPFLLSMGEVVLALMHLWRAVVALPKFNAILGGKVRPGA